MSAAVLTALRKRYAPPAWALLEEVRNAAGFSANRSADAIAMSLWPSRGLEVHGFEVKASRNDWLRELNAPEKAEAVSKYCDRWWLVVEDEALVRDGELPPTWGLLALRRKGLVSVREAPAREGVEPIGRHFLAALLRRATEQGATMVARTDVDAIVKARVDEALERDRERRATQYAETPAARLEKAEAALGVELRALDLPNIKDALELVRDARRLHTWTDALSWHAETAARASQEAGRLLEQAKKLPGAKP